MQFQQHAVAQFIRQQRFVRQQRFIWKFIALPAIWRVLGWQFIAIFILQRVLGWQFIAIPFFQWVNGPKRGPAVGWTNARARKVLADLPGCRVEVCPVRVRQVAASAVECLIPPDRALRAAAVARVWMKSLINPWEILTVKWRESAPAWHRRARDPADR